MPAVMGYIEQVCSFQKVLKSMEFGGILFSKNRGKFFIETVINKTGKHDILLHFVMIQ